MRVLGVVDAISDKSGKAASMLLFPMVAAVVYEVVARYFFNAPTIWAHDMGVFLWAALGISAGAYSLLHRAHVRVDIIYDRFSRRKQAICDVITGIFFIFFVGLALQQVYLMTAFSWRVQETTMTSWHAPLYPLKTLVLVAVVLLLAQGLAKFIRDLFYAVAGRELA